MNDHVSAFSRMATERPIIHIEAPTWTMEILSAVVAVLALSLLSLAGWGLVKKAERDHALVDASFWKKVAIATDGEPTVKLSPTPSGYTCRGFNIDPAFERAVAAECAVLARLLVMARPAPAKP